jgi:hypothetical protein
VNKIEIGESQRLRSVEDSRGTRKVCLGRAMALRAYKRCVFAACSGLSST